MVHQVFRVYNIKEGLCTQLQTLKLQPVVHHPWLKELEIEKEAAASEEKRSRSKIQVVAALMKATEVLAAIGVRRRTYGWLVLG